MDLKIGRQGSSVSEFEEHSSVAEVDIIGVAARVDLVEGTVYVAKEFVTAVGFGRSGIKRITIQVKS